ncbi:MAG TPA: Gfo/Idh/MocA family oxidoreductase [Candidatus Hydrogenedentes bacterium]|nr:Gfo/Idh/MocA family oxidoreductase [Candidatus Hydrogenedentota bacterium]
MKTVTRREFVRDSGIVLMTAGAFQGAWAQPSERVRHAVIGLGGQGRRHAKVFGSFPDCELVAICDVDPKRRAKALEEIPKADTVKQYEDYRKVLNDTSIDTVSIATPDHWHTPIAIAAMKAGKHVYVEKPCCHNVHEGRVLLEAAKKYGKCVQHGTQGRSGEGIQIAVDYLRAGNLGSVRMAKAINHQLRQAIGRAEESEPPEGVNYDMWLGPAPIHRFTLNRWHYNWHWFWDYGCGDLGNDGIHQVDEARWGLGVGMPKAVSASGGQLFYDDDHETPDTQVVTFEFEKCYLLYEMRLWTDYPMEGHDNGVVFYGDKGTVHLGRKGSEVELIGEERKLIGSGADIQAHIRNFLDCVKANTPEKLKAPASEAVISATLCHLGNIATRVSRKLHFDAETWTCGDDQEANALLKRAYRTGYELLEV